LRLASHDQIKAVRVVAGRGPGGAKDRSRGLPYTAGSSIASPGKVPIFHTSLPNSRWITGNIEVQGADCPSLARIAPYGVEASPERYWIKFCISVGVMPTGMLNQ